MCKKDQLIPLDVLFASPKFSKPIISNNGKFLAYLITENDVSNICVKTVGKIDDKQITKSKININNIYWAPNDDQILYLQESEEGCQLAGININTNEVRLYTFQKTKVKIIMISPVIKNKILIGLSAENSFLYDAYELDLNSGELKLLIKNDQNFIKYFADYDLNIRLAEKDCDDGGRELLIYDKDKKSFKNFIKWDVNEEISSKVLRIFNDDLYLVDSKNSDTTKLIRLNLKNNKKEVLAENLNYDISDAFFNIKNFNIEGYFVQEKRFKIVELTSQFKEDLDLLKKFFNQNENLNNIKNIKFINTDKTNLDSESVKFTNETDLNVKPENVKFTNEVNINVDSESVKFTNKDKVDLDFENIKFVNCDIKIINSDYENKKWIVACVRDNGPTIFFIFDKESKKLEFLFYDRPKLLNYNLASMESISFSARDGLKIEGYITFPLNMERKNLPLVLSVHGGPHSRDESCYEAKVQFFQSRGYICLQINYRGSSGYGKKFLEASDKEWGGKMFFDLLDAVRWAIDKGYADPGKIVIQGASYGGYSAFCGITMSDIFACAIAISGISNFLTFLPSLPKSLYDKTSKKIGDLKSDQELLKSRSPINYVNNIKVPVLIAHGEKDKLVKKEESEQMVKAIKKLGLECEYIILEDEGHRIKKETSKIKLYSCIEKFLAKNLCGKSEQ